MNDYDNDDIEQGYNDTEDGKKYETMIKGMVLSFSAYSLTPLPSNRIEEVDDNDK